MRRAAQYVLLCEDKQHEVFLRRFLKRKGLSDRVLRVVLSPAARGAASAFVVSRFPTELESVRKSPVHRRLVVMLDGDEPGFDRRLRQLDARCEAENVPARNAGDPVAVLVPSWNVETWLAYLGGADVDEANPNHPRFTRREKEAWPLVDALVDMCNRQALRAPTPPSLEAACVEYRTRLASLQ